MTGILCNIYRSSKKEGMYLYVDKRDDLSRIPDELRVFFGKPEFSMLLLMTKEKKLARADAAKVMLEIADKGFYLQLPPADLDERNLLVQKNSKLGQL